jgi:ribose/xylose/arabinose/galactoside ABC-type transport system permease subunit
MVDAIFYYFISATLASFAWLVLTGYRPKGESRSASTLHLAAILVDLL